MGTLVVMNGQINAAREVTKTSTIARETFKTLEFGALGVADLGGVRFYRTPLRRQTIPLANDARLVAWRSCPTMQVPTADSSARY